MPTPVVNRFTQWEFTNAELYAATRFSELQLMLIQSLAADAAVRKTNTRFDPTNPTAFAQEEAEIQGELGAYEHLISMHADLEAPEATVEQAKAEISSKPATQPQS